MQQSKWSLNEGRDQSSSHGQALSQTLQSMMIPTLDPCRSTKSLEYSIITFKYEEHCFGDSRSKDPASISGVRCPQIQGVDVLIIYHTKYPS